MHKIRFFFFFSCGRIQVYICPTTATENKSAWQCFLYMKVRLTWFTALCGRVLVAQEELHFLFPGAPLLQVLIHHVVKGNCSLCKEGRSHSPGQQKMQPWILSKGGKKKKTDSMKNIARMPRDRQGTDNKVLNESTKLRVHLHYIKCRYSSLSLENKGFTKGPWERS